MTISSKATDLIKTFEGCSLSAYKDPGHENGLPITIGWGSTMYKDGSKVKMGDTITQEQADYLLQWEVDNKAISVDALTPDTVNQNQFDAVVSFTYNVGVGAFAKSTLLKKIKLNPNDITIRDEFLKWNRSGKKVMKGLTKRRTAEANLYFS